jgi:ABC-2 type transport system ATP-binding protein
MGVMIRVDGLAKRYENAAGELWALGGIDLEVRPGELFGLLGPNGAGKTTTMLILAGLLAPTSGTAHVAGFDVATHPREAKRRTGYIPDRPYVYERLTGRELLRLYGDLYDLAPADIKAKTEHWLEVFGMQRAADELIESYSHGMKQRIVLAATLLVDPEVLIVDEPLVGLDPSGARLFKDLMKQRCGAGKTVLMSTHALEVAEATCDRVGILHRGKVVAVGTVAELRQKLAKDGASLEELFLAMIEGRS